ncbi:glycosyltransferase family 4 protein [bacterium BMS3Abin03]|jgi:glycosyltransferase involved in cell wall biosynthesis|nr:glycosyltransferase family 4 protein [bacterium BMS3Abin03]
MDLRETHLVLFLSRSTPLKKWDQMGILERELAYYTNLAAYLKKVSFVTCGRDVDLVYQPDVKNFEILYNRWGLSNNLYSIVAPFLHYSKLSRGTLYKTNQLDGAWTAVLSGFLLKKIVVLRAGYLWAEFLQKEGSGRIKTIIIRFLQFFSFKCADVSFLPSISDKEYVSRKYKICPNDIYVIPNYVDTALFKPENIIDKNHKNIIYIGRLHTRKNLISLIEACSKLDSIRLTLIGDGPQRIELERIAHENQIKVTFLGVIPHNQIPYHLNISDLFILPSIFEGHPKALIEAMACGIPVIGTDVPGIREVIDHGKTGWLCNTDPDSISEAIKAVINDQELKQELGNNAREYVQENFSLEKVLELETKALKSIVDQL